MLTSKEKDEFSEVPPDFERLENILKNSKPTDQDFIDISIDMKYDSYLEENEIRQLDGYDWFHDYDDECNKHSTYLLDLLKLILKYGYNPKLVDVDQENLYQGIDQYAYGPDTVEIYRLLLENGAEPNMDYDGFLPFIKVDSDIRNAFTKVQPYQERLVYMWLLNIGYGGKFAEGLKISFPFDVGEFKNVYNFTYRIEEESESEGILTIIDKRNSSDVISLNVKLCNDDWDWGD